MKLTYYCDNKRHLVCIPYSVENLHEMAKDLGLNRRVWFHKSKTKLHHYDIPKRRIKEITDKCNEISTREILQIIKGDKVITDLIESGIRYRRTQLNEGVFIKDNAEDASESIRPGNWTIKQLESILEYMKKNPQCSLFSDGSGEKVKYDE